MIDLEPCKILEVSSIVSTFLLSILRVFVFFCIMIPCAVLIVM